MQHEHRRRSRISSVTDSSRSGHAEHLSLYVVDGGIAALMLVAPWFMGGRHPLGQFVVVLLAAIVGVAWPVHLLAKRSSAAWRFSGAEPILAAAFALVLLQLAPVSQATLQTFSPKLVEILPLWMGDGTGQTLGQWTTLTLSPDATRAGLCMLLAYCVIFLVVVQRIGSVEDVERLMRLFAIAGLLMAIVGLLQYLVGNGKFLWVYQHTARTADDAVKGPYINKNHFAHFIALSLGPLLWSVQNALNTRRSSTKGDFSSRQQQTLNFWGPQAQFVCIAIVLFAGLMTFSRGGIAAMGIASLACTGLLLRASLLDKKFLLGGAATFLLAGVALSIHGGDKVTERLDDYTTASMDELDSNQARRKIWAADWRGAQDFLRVGTGIGSHRDVYLMYFPDWWSTEFTHAENGYLQVLLEAGVPGLLLLVAGICLCGYWCASGILRTSSRRLQACVAAVCGGLLASVAHSTADFVWYITSCMVYTTIIVACACRLSQLARNDAAPAAGSRSWLYTTQPVSALACAVVCAAVFVPGAWAVHNRFCAAMASPHWDQYIFCRKGIDIEEEVVGFDNRAIGHLKNYLQWLPTDGRAHIRLANLYIQGVERTQAANPVNAMPISMIRDAALDAFESREDLDRWLTKAVGPHSRAMDLALWHARRGLQFAPLEGQAYTYLTQLDFLDQSRRIPAERCMEQASLVRPYHEKVLLSLGNYAAIRQDFDGAFRYWRELFKRNCTERREMIDQWAISMIPVETILEQCQPELSALRTVYRRYKAASVPVDMTALYVKYRELAEAKAMAVEPRAAAPLWLEAHDASLSLSEFDRASDAARKALQCDPNNFNAHFALAKSETQRGNLDEAETHLRWCIQRRPTSKPVQVALETAVRNRAAGALNLSAQPRANRTR